MSDDVQSDNEGDYIVRVCIDEDFAYEMWKKGINAGSKLYGDFTMRPQ